MDISPNPYKCRKKIRYILPETEREVREWENIPYIAGQSIQKKSVNVTINRSNQGSTARVQIQSEKPKNSITSFEGCWVYRLLRPIARRALRLLASLQH